MATSAKNGSYPRLSAKLWWRLRRQFQKTVPTTAITDTYLATVWDTTPESVKNNYMAPLRKLGFIDSDGKATDRARSWREDEDYKSVCEEILHDIYPQELLDIGPDYNRSSVENWFGRSTGVGEKAKQDMAALFLLLVKGDPTEQDAAINTPKTAKNSPTNSSIPKPKIHAPKSGEQMHTVSEELNTSPLNGSEPSVQQNGSKHMYPSLHIDIQIHISPEAPAEQIDSIFESVAKHLYQGKIANGN